MATIINPDDIRRGDVFWYEFPVYGDDRYAHLIQGRHMVVVVQNNGITQSPRHDRVVVCPISTCREQHVNPDGTPRRSFQAIIGPEDCVGDEPLRHSSVVHLEEMYTLSKADCTRRLFSLTPEAMRRVDAALIIQLDLANQLMAESLTQLETSVNAIGRQFQERIEQHLSSFLETVRNTIRRGR